VLGSKRHPVRKAMAMVNTILAVQAARQERAAYFTSKASCLCSAACASWHICRRLSAKNAATAGWISDCPETAGGSGNCIFFRSSVHFQKCAQPKI